MSARVAGMDRQTLRDRVHRFNAQGVDGLRDLPHTGRPRLLDEAARAAPFARIEAGPDPGKDGLVRWRWARFEAMAGNRIWRFIQ